MITEKFERKMRWWTPNVVPITSSFKKIKRVV
jgi:hypothetical protein